MAMRLSRNMVACLIGERPHGPCLHIALNLRRLNLGLRARYDDFERKKINFFDAETTTRPLSLLERSTTGRPVAPDAQNRY
jgi:hypothetical protein